MLPKSFFLISILNFSNCKWDRISVSIIHYKNKVYSVLQLKGFFFYFYFFYVTLIAPVSVSHKGCTVHHVAL